MRGCHIVIANKLKFKETRKLKFEKKEFEILKVIK